MGWFKDVMQTKNPVDLFWEKQRILDKQNRIKKDKQDIQTKIMLLEDCMDSVRFSGEQRSTMVVEIKFWKRELLK